MSEAGYVLVYALFAAASPTVLLATLVVLGSGRGRLNGLVFLIAFGIGQTLAYLAAFAIGSAVTFGDNAAGTTSSALELAGGIALVAIAWKRRVDPLEGSAGSARSSVIFDRLSRVKPAISFGVGMPLGIGLKRLVLTFLAAATVTGAGLDRRDEVALSLEYLVIAAAIVWVPVLVYLILGPRSDALMESARMWITTHERQLLVGTAFVLGLFLIVDGLLQLVVGS